MTGQLITLPVRIYARGARLLLHAAEDVTGKAVMGTLRVAGALGNLRPGSGASNQTRPTPARPAPQPDHPYACSIITFRPSARLRSAARSQSNAR